MSRLILFTVSVVGEDMGRCGVVTPGPFLFQQCILPLNEALGCANALERPNDGKPVWPRPLDQQRSSHGGYLLVREYTRSAWFAFRW